MTVSKQSLILTHRCCVLYIVLYAISLCVCFMGGYFLGVSRSIKIWLNQQDQKTLNQDYLQKDASFLQEAVSETNNNATERTVFYKALLIGGTKKIVESFVDNMRQKDIILDIEKKISKTKKGREYYWYQATTAAFNSKEELQKLVAVLKKHGKLKDVQIVQYC